MAAPLPQRLTRATRRLGLISLIAGVLAVCFPILALLLLMVGCPTLECDSFGVFLAVLWPALGALATAAGVAGVVRKDEVPDRSLAVWGLSLGVVGLLYWLWKTQVFWL